jgi:hypothetical protein
MLKKRTPSRRPASPLHAQHRQAASGAWLHSLQHAPLPGSRGLARCWSVLPPRVPGPRVRRPRDRAVKKIRASPAPARRNRDIPPSCPCRRARLAGSSIWRWCQASISKAAENKRPAAWPARPILRWPGVLAAASRPPPSPPFAMATHQRLGPGIAMRPRGNLGFRVF